MKRVLVIGDVMLDKYLETEPVRVSDEAPVLIVKKTGAEYILGGAGNTAANLKAMGLEVTLQGVIGDDRYGDIVKKLVVDKGIIEVLAKGKQTTVKMRVLCKGNQQMRIDAEEITDPVNPLLDEEVDVIVVSDYAKGVVGENTVKLLKENYDVPIIINGKPKNVRYYIGADILVINKREADEILDYVKNVHNPDPTYSDIAGLFNILYVVVTRGEEGIEVYDNQEKKYSVPAKTVTVKDITGAGDTVTAALALEISNSGDIQKAVDLANLAGGLKVTKDRTAEVSYQELTLEEINPEDAGRESTEELIERLNRSPSDEL